MRTVVIGDVHGCALELNELLCKLNVQPGTDRIIFTGDLVDRGPGSLDVVKTARALGATVVMGNHDEKHVRWLKHEAVRKVTGKKNPMRFSPDRVEIAEGLYREGLAEWIATWPSYARIDDLMVVVHAGALPNVSIEDQHPNDLLHVRFIDNTTGKSAPLVDLKQPPDSTYWAEMWTGPESIIYGHNVDDLFRPKVHNPVPDVRCYGIDTGCVFGGSLSAMILPDFRVVQVQARAAYSPRYMNE